MFMKFEAACCCNKGKVRKNNEDNFFFDNKILPENNHGSDQVMTLDKWLWRGELVSVFDGLGGEQFGEAASFAAAECMLQNQMMAKKCFSRHNNRLIELCSAMNKAVLKKQEECGNDRMGTTVVAALFRFRSALFINLGDSRAYRIRDGDITQLSKDHVEQYKGNSGRKPPLTQHLGISEDEFIIKPYEVKEEMQSDDFYILCTDGLYDMVSNSEILNTIMESNSCREAAERLLEKALNMGGKDNITVIVCHVV